MRIVRPLRLFFGYTYPIYDVKILAPAERSAIYEGNARRLMKLPAAK